MSKSILELKQVNKSIRDKDILKNIHLTIESGKIYGFVGHNGSGKTMLFRAITGLIYLTSGTIVKDENISVGAMLETPGFLPEYSGLQNLMLLAGIQGKVAEPEVKEAMNRVGLDWSNGQKVKAYSMGMKQKLAIAQAIMEAPSLLLLDEPTNGLDEKSIVTIRNLILEEKQNGTTILIASHNKEDIQILCDEVYRLENGQIVGYNPKRNGEKFEI